MKNEDFWPASDITQFRAELAQWSFLHQDLVICFSVDSDQKNSLLMPSDIHLQVTLLVLPLIASYYEIFSSLELVA